MHELFSMAGRAASMSAVQDVLRAIAQRTASYGCILWRQVTAEGGSYLFVAADWFEDGRFCANHALPLATSFTGHAINNGSQYVVSDPLKGGPDTDLFLLDKTISSFCTTPITFDDGVRGAVNLYSREREHFDEATVSVANDYAMAIPAALRMVEDRVSLRALRSLDALLRSLSTAAPSGHSLLEHVRPAMARVVHEIAHGLNCLEASIFLEDVFETPGQYQLVATTSPGIAARRSYTASDADGVTGWNLGHPEEKVILFDLQDREEATRRYPGMRWSESLDISAAMRVHPKIQATEASLPPLSFMSVPVLDGDRVVGLVRCSVGFGPVYFDESQQAILDQIGGRIGAVWSALLRNRSLESLVAGVKNLNEFAYVELTKALPNENSILTEALQITRRVVPGTEATDIRLLSDDKHELRFAAVLGRSQPAGIELQKTFRVDGSQPSPASADVVRTGKTIILREPETDPDDGPLSDRLEQMIIAPLALGGDIFGVLDVRSSQRDAFPDFAVPLVELLAGQLALYRRLAIVLRRLNETITSLELVREQQTQIHEDLSHQLKSPTIAAYQRVNRLIRSMPDSSLRSELLKLRGVCARAMHVTGASGIFARLARGEPVPITREAIGRDELVRLIINTAQDASYLARGEQKNTFEVRMDGFTATGPINVDRTLLEQALTQLLDNAFKYSFRDSTVIVTGALTRSAPPRLKISVISEGVRLAASEANRVFDRGWQSEEARSVSDTGSGIGLWIVDNIMRAQGGGLEVVPTDAKGRTTFSLLLPIS